MPPSLFQTFLNWGTAQQPKPLLQDQNQAYLEAKNLLKIFRGKRVVDNVSLTLRKGEIIGLLGPNGAGKTTSFSMMTGLLSPDEGCILLNGQDITRLPMYRRARLGIRYLPQESSIFRGLTVEENIKAVLEVLEKDPAAREKQLENLLEEFSLTKIRTSSALTLSGGERRRVEIARALAGNPKFILLDEPLAGIDPKAIGDLRDLILHLKDRFIGILITDHNVRDMLQIVDRAYIINEGHVIKEGTPQEIVSDQNVRQVYLGENFAF
ncbi:MAG: LPS export ABC transporter ATP-binding protein [Alphaproteobacteria bacterium]